VHPEPLTGPDVSLSTYPARTTSEGCRLPPRPAGSSCCQLTLVDLHEVACPLRPTGITASLLLRSGPPLAYASVLSASRFSRLCLFPYHRKPSSQVPYESPDCESRPPYTGHRLASKQVSARPLPELAGNSGFDASIVFRCVHRRFTCARLSNPYMT
jgi:hypothetical protein